MKLVIATVSNTVVAEVIRAAGQINNDWENILELRLYFAAKNFPSEKLEMFENDIASADIVILDLMGAPLELQDFTLQAGKKSRGQIIPIGGENPSIRNLLKLGSLTAGDLGGGGARQGKGMDLDAMQKMMNMAEVLGKAIPFGKPRDMRNYVLIRKYWTSTDGNDLLNLFFLLLRDYGGIKRLPKPKEPGLIEETSICRPSDMRYYDNFAKYAEENPFNIDKPTVALLYYGHNYPNRTSGCVAQIASKLRSFANIIPVAFASATSKNQERLSKIFNEAESKINLIINFMSFRLGAGPMGGDAEAAVDMLKKLNVPVLHPFFMSRREEEEWRISSQGSSPSEFLISVMLPELDGTIETFPVGAMSKAGRNEEYDIEVSELALIEDRVEKLVQRARNWLKLQSKPAKEKKVAIICYNYPPGEDNLFGGAFLDTFATVENLQRVLIAGGYTLKQLKAEELRKIFTEGKTVNFGRWTGDNSLEHMITYKKDNYEKLLEELSIGKEIVKQWGKAPGEIMIEGSDFLIPGIVNGNVFIGLQPSRGVHEQPDKVYHDKSLLPHHQYLAYYQWLRDEFKADIIVHVGTHGTMEFLKGKECGMSKDCVPDMLISDIPHAYLYYLGNPAEAMIAKRRSHAVLIGYQPPVFMEGELYGELSQLETLINELHESKRVDPGRCGDIKDKIGLLAVKLNLAGDDLQELERELYRMKRSLVPRGLHVFGEAYSLEEALEYVKFVLRYDRGKVKSIRRIVAELEGLDYDQLIEDNNTSKLSAIYTISSEWVNEFIMSGKIPDSIGKNPELVRDLEKTLSYGEKVYGSAMECHEKKGFLKVLAGEYLPVRLAGDMIRNPEVFPSGYNLYQFDPRLIPGQEASERGMRIARNTMEEYKLNQGEYPRTTAIILWGLETSRTQGETVGQILHYLGVRVASRKNLFMPSYEIIPLDQLGRPRIDVIINICGFFRDMFPNLIDDMNRIFKQVAELDEPEDMNYFKANSKKIYEKLLEEGYSKEEAEDLSIARIFGPAEADYGTGITKLIETKNWTGENQIGEAYINSLKYVYSKNHRGRSDERLFNMHLQAVNIVSQVRSSHEYEVTDLDHYYEFFGGLSKSIEINQGKKAVVYITDTTGERPETETVDKSIARGVRTRLLNPRWIDSMLEHEYHGVQKISERFENLLGLAATTNKVDNWIFSSLHKTYVKDEDMRRRMLENNRWAFYSMIEILLEINKRGYWKAEEHEIKELMQVYLSLEGDIEEKL